MAVFTAEMRELTRQLIQTITGFEPGEENFRLCFQFAKSNFRFHRYLDVDDLKVSRSVKGLCEKFAVHSQPEKAAGFQRLTEQFLGCSLERSYPKSDAHYGALLLLLCLSDSPLHGDYTPQERPEAQHGLGDSFDWASYLMEGIEFPTFSDDESEEWSEDSEDESEDWTLVKRTKADLNDSAVGEELSDESGHEEEALASCKLWLQEHVVLPYWDRSNPDYMPLKPPPTTTSAHSACNLATSWTAYTQQLEPFHNLPEPVVLSESQVVRETLWVLLGAEKSFVYKFEAEGIGARRDIQVSHLTPLSLRRQLEYFAAAATHLSRMRQFIQAVGNAAAGIPSGRPGVCYTSCQTYEAFADALIHCLEGVSVQLQRAEKRIVDREKFVSLMSLETELLPALLEVQGLYAVFSRGILPSPSQADSQPAAHVCSARLLNTLWDALQFYDTMGTAGAAMTKLLFPLWVMTARPYMRMLEGWMVQGAAADRWEEFPVERNTAVAARSPDYWSRCFQLRDGVPLFLRPAMEKVFLAGKSMHLIESIGKLKQVEQEEAGPTPPNLYDEFLQSVKSELARATPSPELGYDSEETGLKPDSSKGASTAEGQAPGVAVAAIAEGHRGSQPGVGVDSWEKLALWNIDPLLEHFFSTLHVSPPEEVDFNPSKLLWRDLQSLSGNSSLLAPVTELLRNSCLYPLLHRRYTKACGALIQLLRSEYRLTEHFRTVRLFLLMEAGDTMLHFYSDVFQRIQEGGVWWEPSYLNSLLQEVLQGHCPSAEKSLSVHVGDSPYQRTSIYSTGILSLRYEVPWPLDTIFSPPLMQTYNEVFRFLLQVKWAKWSLDEIRTRACTVASLPRDLAFRVHQLLLLRAKLVLFTNNLNNYLMTRILHSVGLEFQANVAQAEDLDSIITLHREYVSTIFDRCLLNKKASYVKEAIMKILSLALSFRHKWEEGISKFSFAEAERIETEFSKCSHFLITCLNNTIKRGSFPHLETLAFSLRSLKSTQKIFTSSIRKR